MPESVYCTMVLTDAYLPGALVLAHELRRLDPDHRIVVLATPEHLRKRTVDQLYSNFDEVVLLDAISQGLTPQLELLDRPDLHRTPTKFHLWSLLDFDRVVYIDADTLPIQSLADLFELPLDSSRSVGASPDSGWPDTFNSGVMVLKPDVKVFDELSREFKANASFDGADQGTLNDVLQWVRIPFVYNVTVTNAYEYLPAYFRFKDDIRLLHFIGKTKPWDANSSQFTQMWWDSYNKLASNEKIVIEKALMEAEAHVEPNFDPKKIVQPPPDYWDATKHKPFRTTESSPPPAVEALSLHSHSFPEYGPCLVRLPFEEEQKNAERVFR